MSFFQTLLDGNNAKEKQKKLICAIAIAITVVLLIISSIAFAICQIVDATSALISDKEQETEQEEVIDLGETTTIQLSENAIYSGNLLTLNDNKHYQGTPELINIYDNRNGAYLSVRTVNRSKFEGTAKMLEKLCEMVVDCNNAIDDNNLIVSGAYDTSAVSTQKGIYSSGEAVALDCFSDEEDAVDGMLPINKVDKYKWIYKNAHKYGFIALSSSSNVFRYVGVTHATAAKSKGFYLDNYLKQLKNASVEAPMQLNDSTIAYYCPINDVKVPKNYSYEMSGNNVDGVIITVYLNSSTSNNTENSAVENENAENENAIG